MHSSRKLSGQNLIAIGVALLISLMIGSSAPAMTPPGNALQFNGANQYVNIPDANSLDLTTNYTLELWFKADSFGSGGGSANLRGLIGKYQTVGSSGYLLRTNLTELDFDQMVTSGLNLQTGRWYHVAAVNSGGTRHLYVNGVEKTITGSATTVAANTDEVRLGSDYRGRYFAGQMDEVRIWNVARSQAEIQDAMHHVLTGGEAGLVSYYNFDQSSGATTLPDLGSGANTGTLMNSPTWSASTIPCANDIAGLSNIRGAWLANTTTLPSSRMNLSGASVTGTDFTLFGHDNASDVWQSSNAPSGMLRLTRVWKMEQSGSVMASINIDTTGLGITDPSGLRLIMNTTTDFSDPGMTTGTFSSPTFTVSGMSLSNGTYYTLGVLTPIATTTTITAHTPDPSAYRQDVTVSYSVTASGAPTGTVIVSDGTVSCTATVAAGSCTLHPVSSGVKTLTATYNGDANYSGSVSAGVAHTMQSVMADSGITFDGRMNGGIAWGDFNNDGNLDILQASQSYAALIYRNDGSNVFTNINAGLPVFSGGRVAWADYDSDGLMDFVVSGSIAGVYTTRVYHNNGDGTFMDIIAGLPGVALGAVSWGDYNNDGRPDLLITGSTGSGKITRIYRNNGDGTFSDSGISLPGITNGFAAWGDYDNDGRLDIALTGDTGSGYISRIYRNTGPDGTGVYHFTDINAGLPGLYNSSVAWGDYDNDGKLDLALSGATGSDSITRIYRNNGPDISGNYTFSDINAGLIASASGQVAWGDFDNDGKLDLAVAATADERTRIYRNNGDSTFIDINATLTNLMDYSGLAWGDYDNDGRLDLLMFGHPDTGRVTKLFHNNSATANTAPTAPANLHATVTNGVVTLTWDAATDAETPAAGLTYNLRVGTTTGGSDVISGMASTSTGLRRVAAMGNVQMNRSWSLTLGQGKTYYWSVQAVDSAFAGGAWGAEGIFGVPTLPDVTTTAISDVTATSAQSGGNVTAEGSSPVAERGVCWNSSGSPTLNDACQVNGSGSGSYVSSITGLTPGQALYVRAYATNSSGTSYGSQYAVLLRDPATPAMAPPGNMLTFNGTSQYIEIPASSDLNLSGAYTLELWFRPAVVSGYQGLLSKFQNPAANGWYLRMNGTELEYGGQTTSGLALTAGLWYHAALVDDNGTRHLYVNGAEVSLTGTAATAQHNDDPLRIGSDYGGRYFNGSMDEVRIWTRARGVQELRESLHLPLTGTESELLAWYNFDETSGTTLSDRAQGTQSAYVHNGVLNGLAGLTGSAWTSSTIQLGDGSASSQSETTGVVTFAAENLALDFTSAGTASITTTRITTAPRSSALFDRLMLAPWWVADRFGSGPFSATVTLTLDSGSLTSADESNPADIGLYSRPTGNDGTWTLVTSASSVNATNQTVTFANVTALGQLAVAHSQNFIASQGNVEMPLLIAAGDYDNDGLPDLALVDGIYHNDGHGVFHKAISRTYSNNVGVMAWGDYDGDGYLDLARIEADGVHVYHNDGNGAFTQTASFSIVASAGVSNVISWGDFDNDGRLDLLAANSSGTHLYRNNGNGTFSEVSAGLPVVNLPRFAWGDYDNDGRLDLAVGSYSSTAIYHNNGNGTFTKTIDIPASASDGSLAWGDYNNDGYLDLAVGGQSSTAIYRSNGPDSGGVYSFSDINAGLPSAGTNAQVSWGDYDNDGRLDLLIGSGQGGVSHNDEIKVFRNMGNDTFVDATGNLQITTHKPTEPYGKVFFSALIDYDSDGRLDLAQLENPNYHQTNDNTRLYLHHNSTAAANSAPAAPGNLQAAVNGSQVTFSWNAASDAETPASGLTYNLRVGTAPGKDDLMPAMADLTTGQRRLHAMGNVQKNRNWTVTLSSGGTYYWSVQAVDTGWKGGSWAAEQAVEVTMPKVTTAAVTSITPTGATSGGTVTYDGGLGITVRGVCWNPAGSPTLADTCTSDGSGLGSFTSTITGLTSGVTYYVRAYATNATATTYGEERKFIAAMNPPGNVLQFNGTDNYVSVADANDLDMTTNYTLETWFMADSFGAAGTLHGLISKYQTSGSNGWLLRVNGSDLDFDQMVTSGLNLQAGQWYHVAAVNSSGTRRLYVNGVEKTITGTPTAVAANNDPLRLGSDFAGRYFAGRMDEVRIWNAARSQADILDAMHSELTGSESGLVAYYTFNQISGALFDYTGNNHTGTLVNNPAWTAGSAPLANAIAGRSNIRGAWAVNTTTQASSRLNLAGATVTGTNFALFGHNSGADDWQSADLPAGIYKRLARTWQAEVSGTATGDIRIDTTGLSDIGDGSLLRLLVDGDGLFGNATIVSGSFSGGMFTVAGQSLLSGSYYTLGLVPVLTVTPSAGAGGTITPNTPQSVVYGAKTSFTIKPGVNYRVSSPVGGTCGGSYTGSIYDTTNGITYTTSGVTADCTVSASFLPMPFEERTATGLPDVRYGVAVWGDYDNDGRLDVLIVGENAAGNRAFSIYHNNGDGTFTDINAGLPVGGINFSSAAWGDYNNDGWLDLLIAGDTESGKITRVYRNNGPDSSGNFSFTDINAGLVGVYDGSVAWGDYNNDGRPDILLTGFMDSEPITRVYRNNGPDGSGNYTFTDINAGLTGMRIGSAAWGDYNNDGRLDILVTGLSASRPTSSIYLNNGDGTFTDINAGLPEIEYSIAGWGDYDNDGRLDILIAGEVNYSDHTGISRVYRNSGPDGSGSYTFTNINAGLFGIANQAGGAWGDYNNDGRPDIIVAGRSGNAVVSKLYQNAGSGVFTEIAANLTGLEFGSAAWGDYDNDGRLDLLMTGLTSNYSTKTKLYHNLGATVNTPPSAPGNLQASANGSQVTFSWGAASDAETPASGLTYNLRIGTGPGKDDLMSAMAETTTGVRRLPAMGNVQQNRNWTVENLPFGSTIYWSVQAIDTAFAGGAWAPEGTLHLWQIPSIITNAITGITVTTAQGGGTVSSEGDSPVIAKGLVWNSSADPTIVSHLGKSDHGAGTGSFSDTLTGLTAGQTYYVRAYATSSLGTSYGATRIFAATMPPPGNALSFNGANSNYVSIRDADDLDLTVDYTLETWFKADSLGAAGALAGLVGKYQTAGSNGYLLRLKGTELDFDQMTTTGLNLQVGQWYHVAAVNANGTRHLYVNGIEKALSGTATVVAANTDELRLGCDYRSRYLSGQMDETRIWNVVRSQTDIQNNMNNELTGSESGLVAYYKFNHISGTALFDVTGKGHDGTLKNGPAWVASTIFGTPAYVVTATASGNGSGTVSSNTGGISYSYPADSSGTSSAITYGTDVVLTATAAAGSTVAWTTCTGTAGGDGTLTATCTFSSIDGNRTAAAVFTENQNTVTYDGNGATDGTVPVDGSSPYASGATVTVLGAGSLTKTGFAFSSWNTLSDGTGAAYQEGETFSITGNIILYAQWTGTPVYTLTLTKAGTGTGNMSVNKGTLSDWNNGKATATYLSGTSVEVSANAGTCSVFGGWGGTYTCVGGSPCTVPMTGDLEVSATFTLTGMAVNHTAGNQPYALIQAALDGAQADLQEIRVQTAYTGSESLVHLNPHTLVLKGGYDCDFGSNSSGGKTKINRLSINSGGLVIESIEIGGQ